MAPPVEVNTQEEGGGGTAALRVSHREEDSMNLEPSLSGKTIVGLIIPPPDIRAIVDKTASFVARNGIDFENKIKEREAANIRFNFLSPADPYHAYYKKKVSEFESGDADEGATAPMKTQLPDKVAEHIQRVAEFVPRHPPKPFEFMADPSTINAFDLDLIRLTALFVARNGRQFLTQLMNREVRNYQFDFLKPQHSNFPYFTRLVEQYNKVIIPPRDVVAELKQSSDHQKLLADVRYRAGWEKHERTMRDRQDAEAEQEHLAYTQIDWHDFVVVQTVDFQPSETLNLPAPCTPKDVGARILLQQRSDAAKAAAEGDAMEVDSDDEEEAAVGQTKAEEPMREEVSQQRDAHLDKLHAPYTVTQPAPAAPTAANVLIRDYDPKKAKAVVASEKYIISPLTNERIPAEKLQDHVRYSTIDPQYKEQRYREQAERQDEDPTNASGTDISKNIAKLAERRTDIFGVGAKGAEQTIIGKKLGEEEHPMQRPDQDAERTIWDGQLSTIDATTRAAQQASSHEMQSSSSSASAASVAAEVQRNLQAQLAAASAQQMAAPPAMPPQPLAMPPLGAFTPMPSRPMMVGIPPPHMIAGGPPMPMRMPMQFPLGARPPFPMPPQFGAPHMLPPPHMLPTPPHMMAHLQHQMQMQGGDEPSAKRMRGEESLMAEGEWLRRVSGPIYVTVLTPSDTEGLDGSPLHFTLDVTSLVSELKGHVQERVGIPAPKLKLVHDGLFLKENFSLAYYNLCNGSILQLQLKERGGKKK